MKFWSVWGFFAAGEGVRVFFHFFASKQVKILFYFPNNINIFAAACI